MLIFFQEDMEDLLMNNINVCLSCDDNYSKYAGVVISSILANANEDDNLSIYVLDGGISEEHKKQIESLKSIKDYSLEFVSVNPDMFEEYAKIKTHAYLTLPAYYRLKMASLLPNLKKIIYLDCDVAVNASLNELFNIDIEDFAVAAVKDINRRMLKKNPKYFNSGVMLFNLEYWRKNNIEETLLNFTKANCDNIKTGDQEVLNRVLYNEVKLIDDAWNVQSSNFSNRSSYISKPKIIHFVCKNKPWKKNCFSYHKDLYFKYLQLTPWKLDEEELRQALKSTAFEYVKYRPFFLFRPRFYVALFKTYFCKK